MTEGRDLMRRIRRFYWRRIRRWRGETCDDCGRRYWPVIWRAADADWLAVTHRGTRFPHLLCPACFSWRYERFHGFLPLWRPSAE